MSGNTFPDVHDTADVVDFDDEIELELDFEDSVEVEVDVTESAEFSAAVDSESDDSEDADSAASDSADEVPFSELGLPEGLVELLGRNGVRNAFPVQAATIPDALAGRHVLGKARTGSGKTLAFGLPMLANLAGKRAAKGRPLGLILVPTRELAMQVSEALRPYGYAIGVDIAAVFGGAPMYKQVFSLRRGVEVLVATPGRLTDLIEQEECDLSEVEIAVLDEADQMADMGFLPIVSELLGQTDPAGQRLLFSATLDGAVDELVQKFMTNPVLHSVAGDEGEPIKMDHHLLVVEPHDKSMITAEIAARHTPGSDDAKRTILFARTKLGADRIAEKIREAGVQALALHGGMTQAARTKTLADFKLGRVPVLVATDVAARGIHVDGIDLVLHVDPANDAKDYLHRAGRTARAGEAGTVVTLVLPKQRKATLRLLEQAGVEAALTKVAPSSDELRELTGGRPVAEYTAEADAYYAARRAAREAREAAGGRDSRGGRGGYERDSRGGYDRDSRGGHGGRGGFGTESRGGRGGFGGDSRGGRGGFGGDSRGGRGGFDRDSRGERGGFGGERRPFGSADGQHGGDRGGFDRDRTPRGDRPAFGERGDRDSRGGFGGDRGARPAFNRDDNRGGFNREERRAEGFGGPRGGERGPWREPRDRRSFGDGDRGGFDRAPRGDRPGFENRGGGRPAYGDRDTRGGFGGERRSFGSADNRGGGFNRDDRGGRPSYGDRDNRGGFNRDDRGGRGGFGGERRPFGDRENRAGFNRDDRGGRPSYGDRDNRGGFNRDDRGGRGGFTGERRSFGSADNRHSGDRDSRGGDRNDRGPGTFSRNGGERRGFGNRDSRPPRDRRW